MYDFVQFCGDYVVVSHYNGDITLHHTIHAKRPPKPSMFSNLCYCFYPPLVSDSSEYEKKVGDMIIRWENYSMVPNLSSYKDSIVLKSNESYDGTMYRHIVVQDSCVFEFDHHEIIHRVYSPCHTRLRNLVLGYTDTCLFYLGKGETSTPRKTDLCFCDDFIHSIEDEEDAYDFELDIEEVLCPFNYEIIHNNYAYDEEDYQ
ncbi:hypothetical protein TetV_418 [Tetraselmis virus 1]|uniref:Uncharacterized protein n=1 Tax=Tetraselmis virus 1 TaxID=2060617 RepID=A0A2P0VNQ3_9VIRU|nr:hypothetical protein QJ968_gp636 [Tetraselmis virus 1]AUF82500.1 hypothetical protein TetV_418 [Tetraselmis virus 1]